MAKALKSSDPGMPPPGPGEIFVCSPSACLVTRVRNSAPLRLTLPPLSESGFHVVQADVFVAVQVCAIMPSVRLGMDVEAQTSANRPHLFAQSLSPTILLAPLPSKPTSGTLHLSGYKAIPREVLVFWI